MQTLLKRETSETLSPGFEWIESFNNLEKKLSGEMREFRLDRMEKLCRLFDNPERSARIIHVAGSKGKGSTAAFIAHILSQAGYKTGLYTSPHLQYYYERFTILNESYETDLLEELIFQMKDKLEELPPEALPGGEPTTFELLTLLGFILFREKKCKWIVLETGLGGRLDATNIVDPAAVVITPIELEHTSILGNTLGKIAEEKAGIIKTGRPVFCAEQKNEALKVLEKKASDMHADFHYLPNELLDWNYSLKEGKGDVNFIWIDGSAFRGEIGIPGSIQGKNMALAHLCLSRILPNLSENAFLQGAAQTRLPGRTQVLRRKPFFILDGAHTPHSIHSLLETWNELSETQNPRKASLIFGSQDDKQIGKMAEKLIPHFENIVITTPGYFKQSSPENCHDVFTRTANKLSAETRITLIKEPALALKNVLKNNENPVLCCGSFHLGGEILKEMNKRKS